MSLVWMDIKSLLSCVIEKMHKFSQGHCNLKAITYTVADRVKCKFKYYDPLWVMGRIRKNWEGTG